MSTALRAADPHHLYLGTKFAYYPDEVIAACAEYADVLSFDNDGGTIGDYSFLGAYPKPALIAEFGFGAADRGLFWGNVGTQTERGVSYATYLARVVANPQFVGLHWFEYGDEPTAGRGLDGENGNTGFVSVTDEPYPEFVAAAKTANGAVYATKLAQ